MRNKFMIYCNLFMLLLISSCQTINNTKVKYSVSGEIYNYGPFIMENARKVPNSLSPTGSGNLAPKATFFVKTDIIPLKIGSSFGFEYKLEFDDDTISREIIIITISPLPILNPKTGVSSVYSVVKRIYSEGVMNYTGYLMEKDEELIPGQWKFIILHRDHIVLEKMFNIIP